MINKEQGEYLTMPLAVLLAGAFIGFGVYMGGRAIGGGGTDFASAGAPSVQAPSQQDQVQPNNGKIDPVTSADHIRGNPKAKVFIVEYSDPECPFCKKFHPTLKDVMKKYEAGGQVAWIYRNFPIESLHSKAAKESEATECAAELGGNDGFWKYYDRLFEVTPGNNGLDAAQLPVIAKDIGLDVAKFNACLSSGKYASKIKVLIDGGIKAGVNGTPTTFIVSGDSFKQIVGAVPAEQIQSAVDEALKK